MEKKLPKLQALRVCRSILESGSVILTHHARMQITARNIEMEDVLRVIKTGSMPHEPDINPTTREYEYKIRGRTADGKEISVCLGICKDDNKMFIITVF
jgi:hypothetical protein